MRRLAISGYRSLRAVRNGPSVRIRDDNGERRQAYQQLASFERRMRLHKKGPMAPPLKRQFAVIQVRASRWAIAISTSDMISATSRRSGIASVRPFRAARLNHVCAATRLTTPERPLAQYSPRSNSTSGVALASTGG